MLQTATYPRFQIVSVLAKLCKEWQEAAQGESLTNVEGNIGLVLADLINALGLSTHEQSVVLGQALFEEMREILSAPPTN